MEIHPCSVDANCQQNHTCDEAVTETQPQTQILQETQVGLKIKQMCEATKLALNCSLSKEGYFLTKFPKSKFSYTPSIFF